MKAQTPEEQQTAPSVWCGEQVGQHRYFLMGPPHFDLHITQTQAEGRGGGENNRV